MNDEEGKTINETNNTSTKDNIDERAKRGIGIMLASQTKHMSLGGQIVDKLTTEQIPDFFKHIEKRDENSSKDFRFTTVFIFLSFLCIIALFIFIILVSRDPQIAKEITIGLLSFLGGGGLGFGVGKRQKGDA